VKPLKYHCIAVEHSWVLWWRSTSCAVSVFLCCGV